MYLDKLIKREFLALVVSVITITIIIFAIFYMKNSNMNNINDNTLIVDNLEIKYCLDINCKETYNNLTNTIGTKTINGKTTLTKINNYEIDSDALNQEPYIFNVKNISENNTNLTIKLINDEDYQISDYIKVGITNCSNNINIEDINIYNYSELEDNTLIYDDLIASNKSNTYCLWTWSNNINETEEYFMAKIDYISKIVK